MTRLLIHDYVVVVSRKFRVKLELFMTKNYF